MGGTKVKDLPAHKRPRESLWRDGVVHLSTSQLIAILIGSGTTKHSALSLAAKLLKRYSLKKLSLAKPESLMSIPGVGQAIAARIVAAFELGRRGANIDLSLPLVSCPQEVLLVLGKLSDYRQEHLISLYLDSRHRLLKKLTVAIGSVNTTLIHPREIFAPALELPTSAVILAHNHPSTQTEPSEDDLRFTNRVVEAGKIIGIDLLDHLIVSRGGYFSFREQGLI